MITASKVAWLILMCGFNCVQSWTAPGNYEYVLVYMDDVLCISHKPSKVIELISVKYILNPGSLKEPTEYVCTKVRKYILPDH